MKIKYIISLLIGIMVLIFLAGCGSGSANTRAAKEGDTVSVHYTGTLEDGTKFDSSYDRGQPLSFTIGAGQMIAGFDDAVRGMKVGDTKTVTIPPEEAYGERIAELVVELSRDKFPADMALTIGQQIPMQNNLGQQFMVTIVEIGPDTVTIDANHELAGKALIFKIELVSITPGED